MKKNLLGIMAVLLLLGGSFVACDKSTPTNEEEPQKESGLSFTEYSLTGTSSNWTNLDNLKIEESKLIVINSDEELQNYVTGDYPLVDFSKKTLLLAYGLESYQNIPDDKGFHTSLVYDLEMTVNLRPSLSPALLEWRVALLVDKLNKERKIELVVTRTIKE
jgi:hypothetical protein